MAAHMVAMRSISPRRQPWPCGAIHRDRAIARREPCDARGRRPLHKEGGLRLADHFLRHIPLLSGAFPCGANSVSPVQFNATERSRERRNRLLPTGFPVWGGYIR